MTYFCKIHRMGVSLGVLLAVVMACRIGAATPVSQSDAPTVNVTGPQAGQIFLVDEPIPVNSVSVDPDGIERVELWVDGSLVRVDNNPNANSPYIVAQAWQSNVPGTHVIVVKAFDPHGMAGESQPAVITLEAETRTHPLVPSPTQVTLTTVGVASPTLVPSPATGTVPSKPSIPAPTTTPSPTSSQPAVMCTPPPCNAGEVTFCPDDCPGGCGTRCATPTLTPTPPVFEPTGIQVHDIFKPIWEKANVGDYLGYPVDKAVADRRYAKQYFEKGYLYWWDRPEDRGLIWVVEMPQPGVNQGSRWSGPYEDMWDGKNPYACAEAQANSNGPIRGFGKLWCDTPGISQAVGSAQEEERGTGESTNYGVVQFFQNGVMLYSPLDHQVFVLFNGGTWQRYPR